MTAPDPSTPKRPRGRPRKPGALTAAQRQAARRAAGARDVLLPPDTAADALALQVRDGHPSMTAAIGAALRTALHSASRTRDE